MPAKRVDQVGMDEAVIEDEALLEALEAREEARDELAPYRVAYKAADTAAKVEAERAVPLGTIARVGRFRVSHSVVGARHVEFDTEAKAKVSIELGDG